MLPFSGARVLLRWCDSYHRRTQPGISPHPQPFSQAWEKGAEGGMRVAVLSNGLTLPARLPVYWPERGANVCNSSAALARNCVAGSHR